MEIPLLEEHPWQETGVKNPSTQSMITLHKAMWQSVGYSPTAQATVRRGTGRPFGGGAFPRRIASPAARVLFAAAPLPLIYCARRRRPGLYKSAIILPNPAWRVNISACIFDYSE